jgi:low affinity Fe/Cu permease
LRETFDRWCYATAIGFGHPLAVTAAVLSTVGWTAVAICNGFEANWLLIFTTFTSIVSYLMLFVLQNSQNRLQQDQARGDAALHLKLDELIRVTGAARNAVVGAEERAVEEIQALKVMSCDPD